MEKILIVFDQSEQDADTPRTFFIPLSLYEGNIENAINNYLTLGTRCSVEEFIQAQIGYYFLSRHLEEAIIQVPSFAVSSADEANQLVQSYLPEIAYIINDKNIQTELVGDFYQVILFTNNNDDILAMDTRDCFYSRPVDIEMQKVVRIRFLAMDNFDEVDPKNLIFK